MDPRQRHLPPLELTMTDDPITAALQQLADHHDQLTQLAELVTGIGDTLREHQAALEKLAQTPPADPDGYHPGPPPTGPNPSPGYTPGSSRSIAPATATWPPPSPRAGARTTCACTAWTSCPTC